MEKYIPLIDRRVKATMNILLSNFVYCQANSFKELLYSPILVNSLSNSARKLLNYPPFCKFYTDII
jgi:hypothetical protein